MIPELRVCDESNSSVKLYLDYDTDPQLSLQYEYEAEFKKLQDDKKKVKDRTAMGRVEADGAAEEEVRNCCFRCYNASRVHRKKPRLPARQFNAGFYRKERVFQVGNAIS